MSVCTETGGSVLTEMGGSILSEIDKKGLEVRSKPPAPKGERFSATVVSLYNQGAPL
jgi:hypothetical protein